MDSVTAAEIAKLETMTVSKLVEKFESLVGEKCRSRNKRYLIRRIAWRLQANAEGGLSERALMPCAFSHWVKFPRSPKPACQTGATWWRVRCAQIQDNHYRENVITIKTIVDEQVLPIAKHFR
jgi:hypothetical protein